MSGQAGRQFFHRADRLLRGSRRSDISMPSRGETAGKACMTGSVGLADKKRRALVLRQGEALIAWHADLNFAPQTGDEFVCAVICADCGDRRDFRGGRWGFFVLGDSMLV
ncbi:hypothetical protein [Ralstonia solanacearum]|uniref:Uncharacterized protein n=1 Tax=Ralstonia solanacearum TaxID=305 RepID=A0AAE3NCP5_RALSL|nr:hypothetical protein [Ralstonia solanacearum]MDB0520667.1 hypothetical protein [Ralstonia solanacearum]